MVMKLYIKKHLYESKKIPQHAWLIFFLISRVKM
jgi:hypothetical protein